MRCSISSSASLALAMALAACAGARRVPPGVAPAAQRGALTAVLPPENLSGSSVPLTALRRLERATLEARGLALVPDEKLTTFMAAHRMRYTGGVSRESAQSLRDELGVENVLVTSVVLYAGAPVPRFGVITRLVSAQSTPRVLWMDGEFRAGNDSVGLLGLGLVRDPDQLTTVALGALFDRLGAFLDGTGPRAGVCLTERRFAPATSFVSPELERDHDYSVAIVPFLRYTGRRGAGEAMSLELMRELHAIHGLDVAEPGVVRELLLQARIIMEDGVSFDTARVLLGELDADLVLAGRVFDYQEVDGDAGVPRVSFSAQLLERDHARVLWNASSYATGDDGVWVFDLGRVHTAPGLACRLASTAAAALAVGRVPATAVNRSPDTGVMPARVEHVDAPTEHRRMSW
jgi:hypothetical protein